MRSRKFLFIFGVWLCVYPLVTIILFCYGQLGLNLPLPVKTLILTLILVPLMVLWIVPFVRSRTEGMRQVPVAENLTES